jgi:hypothetical protein
MQTGRMPPSGLREPQGRPPAARLPFVWSLRYREQLIDLGCLLMVDDRDGRRFICVKYCRTMDAISHPASNFQFTKNRWTVHQARGATTRPLELRRCYIPEALLRETQLAAHTQVTDPYPLEATGPSCPVCC